jgi:UDP-N-acetylmuramate dehydrogenase
VGVPTPLSELTTLRLGGPPRRLVEAGDEAELVASVREADAAGEPVLVLAGGSNVVVADDGFPGTVVRVLTRGIERREVDGRLVITAQAGEPWEAFVDACVAEGLAGIESLAGIPGSIGATPIQNVGAHGQEVAQTITSVRVLDRERDVVEDLPAAAAGFAYRSSAFKRTPGHRVVLAVTFALERRELSGPLEYAELARALDVRPGEGAPLAEVREAVLVLRRGKGMVVDPADPDSVSAGSFFTWLIEHAGFTRGYGNPEGIAISHKHTLALTNRGAGTTTELVALAREIAGGVREHFGVELTPEPVLVGPTWP